MELLRSWSATPGIFQWADKDTKDLYDTNLEKYGPSWSWAGKRVEYHRNSQGYRCPEFDTIDWATSTLLLGCSFVFGTGLDEPDTLSARLGAVNLGHHGASVMHIWGNTQRLSSAGVNPRRVIYFWPSVKRVAQFRGGPNIMCGGPWNGEHDNMIGLWADDDMHNLGFAVTAVKSSQLMWTCPQYHYTWCPDLAQAMDMPLLTMSDPKYYSRDRARDGTHPGVTTVGKWADRIAQDLD